MEHDEHRRARRHPPRRPVGAPQVAYHAIPACVALTTALALWLMLAPHAAAHASAPTVALVPHDLTTNGLAIVGALSCVVAMLGIFISSVALTRLLRAGYGPFLRSLLHGKRTGNRRRAGPARRPAQRRDGSRDYHASAAVSGYAAPIERGSRGDGGRAQAALVRSTSVERRAQPATPGRARAR